MAHVWFMVTTAIWSTADIVRDLRMHAYFLIAPHVAALTADVLITYDLVRAFIIGAYSLGFPLLVALTVVFSPIILLVISRTLLNYRA
jgi:hypothetical protein